MLTLFKKSYNSLKGLNKRNKTNKPSCEDKDKLSLKSSNMSVNFGSECEKILAAEYIETSFEHFFIFGLILSKKLNTMHDKLHISH